jgi:hypothetical protein
MQLDSTAFRSIVGVVPGDRLLAADARTIVQIAELAAGVDLDDDADERILLEAVGQHVCASAGIARDSVPVVSPLPLDHEDRMAWICALATQLTTTGARELAYVIAYLLTASDLELAPVESTFLGELREALSIPEERASELLATVTEIVTPGARDTR